MREYTNKQKPVKKTDCSKPMLKMLQVLDNVGTERAKKPATDKYLDLYNKVEAENVELHKQLRAANKLVETNEKYVKLLENIAECYFKEHK